MGAVNLGKARIEAMLKVLDVEGAVTRDGTQLDARAPAPTGPTTASATRNVTALRRREQAAMAAFGADGRCLMRALQEELDDPDPADCGVCAVCTAPRFDGPLDPALVREAALHLRSRPLILDVKKMAPDAEGKMRKLGDDVRAEEGRALARLGDGGWDPLVQAGRRDGRFDDELVGGGRRGRPHVARRRSRWVAAVPSRRSGELVPDFAQRLAAALGLPFHPVLERVGDNPPQREMANSAQQVANVRGEFAVTARRRPRRACSSTTSASAAGRWRWSPASCAARARAPVYPLALSTAF